MLIGYPYRRHLYPLFSHLSRRNVSWVNSQVSWVNSYVSWAISKVSWAISHLSWAISQVSWVISYVSWAISKVSWAISYVSWVISFFRFAQENAIYYGFQHKKDTLFLKLFTIEINFRQDVSQLCTNENTKRNNRKHQTHVL